MVLKPMKKMTPKRAAALLILVAMAMVVSYVEFPLFPSAPWLKYDPSGIVVLIAALLYGPWVGMGIAFLAWVPRLVTDPLGAFMNILAALTVALVLGFVYRAHPDRKHAILGALAGSVLSIAVSVGLNFLITPIYTGATVADIAATVWPVIVPFNAVKLAINCIFALVSYRKLEKLLAEPSPGDKDGAPDA